MQSATTDQVAELGQRVHELELKMISVSSLEARHETWRSAFLDMLAIVMVVVTLIVVALAYRR